MADETLHVTRDGIYYKVPAGVDPEGPEAQALVNAERLGRRKRSQDTPEFKAKVEAQREQDRAAYDPTEGMSGIDKVRANWGAGVNSAWEGLKQVMPGMKGASDEEVTEKRQRDAALAKSTDLGVGADWMPTAGSALQFAGEVSPSLAVPGGPLVGPGSKALTKALPLTMKAVGALTGGPIRAGLTGGAVAGALAPTTSDESRTINTLGGAAAGAVLPGAVSAFRRGRGMLGADKRAGRQLLDAVGGDDEVAALERKLAERTQQRVGEAPEVRAVPESLSEATGSVPISRVESQLGRSDATLDDMAAFRRAQNEARYGASMKATREADQIAGRDAVRAATTDPMREQALTAAGGSALFHAPVLQAAEATLRSPQAANPSVQRVAKYVLGEVSEGTEKLTPERLYEVRKVLAGKLEGPSAIGDELGAAVKGAQRETKRLIASIDAALDTASGGQWTPYLKTYGTASRGVDEAVAAREVRDVINETGRPLVGEAPELARGRLTQAINAARGGKRDFPLQLSPSAGKSLDDLLAQIQRAEEPARTRKLTGTQGGGSQTSTDLDSVLSHLAKRSSIPFASDILEAIGGRASDATKRELVTLIQDPQRAMLAIKAAQAAKQPLSQAQEILQTMASRSTATALPLATQQR